jgi:hypothetical protein
MIVGVWMRCRYSTASVLFLTALLPAVGQTAESVDSQRSSDDLVVVLFSIDLDEYGLPEQVVSPGNERFRAAFRNSAAHTILTIPEIFPSDSSDPSELFPGGTASVDEVANLLETRFGVSELREEDRGILLVIPSVSFYEERKLDSDRYYLRLEVTVRFVTAGIGSAVQERIVAAAGLSADLDAARNQILEELQVQTAYQVRSIDRLRGARGILEVDGRVITIEYGRNDGVIRGDLYALDGDAGSGLLKVKTVDDDLSYGVLLYSDDPPAVGKPVEDAGRIGFDTSVYVRGLIDFMAKQRYGRDPRTILSVGVRQGTTLGMYTFRPVIGIEVGFPDLEAIPMHVYAGADIRWYIRRVQITPFAGGGIGFVFQNADTQTFAYAGGLFQLNVSVLFGSRIRLFVEGGGVYWHGIGEYDIYGGISFGGGIQIEY